MLNQVTHSAMAKHGRQLIERMRFQLPLGLLLSVVLPTLTVYFFTSASRFQLQSRNSMIASGCAFLLAFFLTRRLQAFPGINRVGTEIPIYISTFALSMVVLLILRQPYSNLLLFSGFAMTLTGFAALAAMPSRRRRLLFLVVPFGQTERLQEISNADFVAFDAWGMIDVIRHNGIVADLRADLPAEWERMLADAALRGVPVYHVKQVEEALTGRVDLEHLSENSFGSLLPNRIFADVKSALDRLVALLLLPFLIIPLALVACVIRIDSPGPVIFNQIRNGRGGRPFVVHKFRSMYDGQDRSDERSASMTLSGDKRITRVGAIIRRYRIDELPQIFNVLKGEMSWIGPRPEALALSEWYQAELPFYSYRHIVRPGVTGWAQVNQGHVSDLSSVHEKLRYDFYYIKFFSFWLDLLIILRTVRIIFGGYGVK